MNLSRCSLKTDMSKPEKIIPIDRNKIVIFGAGKIGRSFIGQLFGCSGYKVVFVDTDTAIISRLNSIGSYRVIIKGEKEEEIIVNNIQAISAFEKDHVTETVSTAGILAVSVGKSALEKVIPSIAAGLVLRYERNPESLLDIIIAENMRNAAEFFRERLLGILPKDYPLLSLVGLIETSIGKMVPIMTQDDIDMDPLMIFAEPYNTLILDGSGFKGPIPDVEGLAPKDNIKAWVDRKAFIHNLGHATATYYGFYRHPEAVFLFEVLEDQKVFDFTKEVMLQSAEILRAAYPSDFTENDLEEHINDLLFRFRNRALRDTLFRVGNDLTRKLAVEDRFMGAIRLATQLNMPYNMILKAMSYGFNFRAKDEKEEMFFQDFTFLKSLANDFELTLIRDLGFNPNIDKYIITELKKQHISNQDLP